MKKTKPLNIGDKNAPKTVEEFKAFAKRFANIAKVRRIERKQAVGLLTPDLIREYSKGGKKYGQTLTLFDRAGREYTYTPQDIAEFSKVLKRSKKSYDSKKKGAPIVQLLGKSMADRKKKSKGIGRATIYRVQGNVFHFRVPADLQSTATHYNVMVRLDEWEEYVHSTEKYKWAVKKVVQGRVSYECSCLDHRYRYRYLATVNNCAVRPLEYDFPKIVNPGLEGSCCKHTIKALHTVLNSPSVHRLLAKEMEVQAKRKGYASNRTAFLKQSDLDVAKKVKPKRIDPDELDKAWKDHQKAIKAWEKKQRQPGMKEKVKAAKKKARDMKAENRALKAERKHLKARAEKEKAQIKRDMLLKNLGSSVSMAKKFKIPMDSVLSEFAKTNNMSMDEVKTMGKSANIL